MYLKRGLKLLIGLLLVSLVSFQFFAQDSRKLKVAVHIFIHDGDAFRKSHNDFYQAMFKELQPDIKFKVISVEAGENINQIDISKKLKYRITNALGENEVLSHLIIDTHGNTREKLVDGITREYTTLKHLGDVFERRVSANFHNVFSPLKGRGTSDMQVILNSCYTLCGPPEKSSKRAATLLRYFGGSNGSIYGSYTAESSEVLNFRKFLKLKYFIPNYRTIAHLTILTFTTAFFTIGALGYARFSELGADGSLQEYIKVGSTIGYTISSSLYLFANAFTGRGIKGYQFKLKNGKVSEYLRIDKYRDIRRLIAKKLNLPACNLLFE